MKKRKMYTASISNAFFYLIYMFMVRNRGWYEIMNSSLILHSASCRPTVGVPVCGSGHGWKLARG